MEERGAVGDALGLGTTRVQQEGPLADLLPREILERRKHGFSVPLGDWFRGELRPLVQDTLLSRPRLGRRLRIDGVRQIFDEHVSGRADRGHQLWTLLTLELWLRKHGFD